MNPKETMERAKEFAKLHIKECASEVIQWKNTSNLEGPRLRELAKIISELGINNSLQIAQGLVETEALTIVSKMRDDKTVFTVRVNRRADGADCPSCGNRMDSSHPLKSDPEGKQRCPHCDALIDLKLED